MTPIYSVRQVGLNTIGIEGLRYRVDRLCVEYIAEPGYADTVSSVKPPSPGEESRANAEGEYSQTRPVDLHREQTGFSRLQRTFDFVQLLQAFLRGGRCLV